MQKVALTTARIRALPAKQRSYIVWDSRVRGFGVSVYPSGHKAYVAQRQVKGKRILRTLYDAGAISVNEARDEASRVLLDMARGDAPCPSRLPKGMRAAAGNAQAFPRAANNIKTANCEAMTVEQLAERFMAEYLPMHNKPGTVKLYGDLLRNHIIPRFGECRIDAVTPEDAHRFHYDMRETPNAANNALKVCLHLYERADVWELYDGRNPFRRVRKYPEKMRERFLTDDELTCLLRALEDREATCPMPVAAFRLLLHTGARRGEILTAQWDFVKDDRLVLPTSKTGRKTVYLSEEALKVLHGIPRAPGGQYIIAGTAPDRHLHGLQKHWEWVRERATMYLLRDYSTREMGALVREMERAKAREIAKSEWYRKTGQRDVIAEAETYLEYGKHAPSVDEALRNAKNSNMDMRRIIARVLPAMDDFRPFAETRGFAKLPKGMMDFRIHDLRHNFASQAVMSGMSLHIVGRMLGHSQTSTTARYAHLDGSVVQAATRDMGRFFGGKGIKTSNTR